MAKQIDNQLILPLDLMEDPKYAERIKQNWKFTFSNQVITSVFTKRAIGCIIAQIKQENAVKDYYQIRSYDIITETSLDKSNIYKKMKEVVNELVNVVYFFENEEEEIFIPRHFVDTTRYENPVGYHKGVLTVAFNPALKPMFLQLAQYTDFELNTYLRFSSWYSMRLYELLSSFKDTGWWQVSINKYRELMGCAEERDNRGRTIIDKKTGKPKVKYPKPADLVKYTTQEAHKELANTECAFDVFPIYDITKVGSGRRPIVEIRFELKHKQTPAKQQIEKWCKLSEQKDGKFKRMCERLKNYKVTDDLIVKYGKIIGSEKLNKLLHEWDLRQKSNSNRIENPEKYCNKVIADIGKKLIENQTKK